MTIPKKKREKIRKYLEDGKTWEYIRNKTGVSNDGINNIRREPLSSLTSTILQADKTTRVDQDPTIQKQRDPTSKNPPDSHVLHLEQKISNVDQGLRTNNQQLQNVVEILNELKQSQQKQETKEPLPEKPDDPRDINELKHQEIKAKSLPTPTQKVQQPNNNQDQTDALPQETQITLSPSKNPDDEQTLKTNLNQTDTSPENQENEQGILSRDTNPDILLIALGAAPSWIKLFKDIYIYKKTGFFPQTHYIKNQNNTKNETKIKKPIIGNKSIPSSSACFLNPQQEKMYRERIANSQRIIEDSLRKTNEQIKKLNKYSSR